MNSEYGNPTPALVVIAVDPNLPGMSRVVDKLHGVAFLPGKRALYFAILTAKNTAEAEGNRPIVAILPSNHMSLVTLAARDPAVERIALYHSGRADLSRLKKVTARAGFSLVDLTIVPDDWSMRNAIELGADPDRIARTDDPVLRRLLAEPRRRDRANTALEALASIALDAAEMCGLVRLAERLSPDKGVNVVNYHRVLPLRELRTYPRPQMALAEPVFEAQVQAIATRYGFTEVERVRERTEAGRVAITFDDGYEDNYRVALPVLKSFDAPACVFVATNIVGQPGEFWWDKLGRTLFAYWESGAKPPLPDEVPERATTLRYVQSIEAARSVISDVLSELNEVDELSRRRAVDAMTTLVQTSSEQRTMLSWDEVRRMAQQGVTFGSHTRNHVVLDQVPEDVAKEELVGSQVDLERRLNGQGPPSKVVALPRGKMGPFQEDDLRSAGFSGVMTTEAGINRSHHRSIFVLRRDGKMLTLRGRHHPAKLRLEMTGLVDWFRGRRAG